MADGRRNNGGTKGNKGGGRPSKSDEQELIKKLTPMAPAAHKALGAALKAGEPWAVKLWYEYYYGKPRQTTDINMNGDVSIDPKEFIK